MFLSEFGHNRLLNLPFGLARPWIWLAGIGLPLGNQPGDNICNFLRRHHFAWRTVAPIGLTQVRATGNDGRAQILITNQGEK